MGLYPDLAYIGDIRDIRDMGIYAIYAVQAYIQAVYRGYGPIPLYPYIPIYGLGCIPLI